jgi:hypothetical protein
MRTPLRYLSGALLHKAESAARRRKFYKKMDT